MIAEFELLDIARDLTNEFDCLLFGSLGLKLTYPQVLEHAPHDADLVTGRERAELVRMIRWLQARGYDVHSWQDRVDGDFDFERLTGRIYFRAEKRIPAYDPVIVDMNYEYGSFDYLDLKRMSSNVQGIRILNRAGYIRTLSTSDREKDFVLLQKLLRCDD
ncbi:MAG: hypothetical protein IJU23_11890 [Proteobacteria bacterium]|nr:hypothetical protein [Pseudomonadota bacterium]